MKIDVDTLILSTVLFDKKLRMWDITLRLVGGTAPSSICKKVFEDPLIVGIRYSLKRRNGYVIKGLSGLK